MVKFFAAAALAMTLAFPMTAQAATCTTGSCSVGGADGQALSGNVVFDINEIGAGAFTFTADFLNDTASNGVGVAAFLVSANQGAVSDLMLNITGPGSVAASYALVNDVVTTILLVGAPYTTIDFTLTGTATQGAFGGLPDINLTLAPVPVPAAGLMLLTVVGAGAFAARRKKKKA